MRFVRYFAAWMGMTVGVFSLALSYAVAIWWTTQHTYLATGSGFLAILAGFSTFATPFVALAAFASAQAGVTRMGGDGEAGSVAEGHSTRSRSDAPNPSSPSPSNPEIPNG